MTNKNSISGDPPHAWKEYAASGMHRNLDCEIDEGLKKAGYYYNCSTIPLFDLGSLHHDFYLVSLIMKKIFLSAILARMKLFVFESIFFSILVVWVQAKYKYFRV